ncbi:MATE family efflux transporter [Algiphilus sp.]|uniref:MATE family efflux transporter n=1 Tax=Algiphilus sp. TaxID=1872431 RepID=UPI0032EF79C7
MAAQLPRVFAEVWSLVKLATPIVVALAAAVLIGVVDTIMIAPLGTAALAGASIAASVILIFYSALYGLVSVCGVLIAQAFGAKDDTAVGVTVKASLVVSMLSGLVAAMLMVAVLPLLPIIEQPREVVDILRPYWLAMSFVLVPYAMFYALKGLYDATDKAWLGVVFSFVAVVVNVPANWVLIYGIGAWQGLGLLGAGLASFIAQAISLVVAVAYWRMSKVMSRYRTNVGLQRSDIVVHFREGSPLALCYAGEGGAFAVAGLMLGLFGASALAANQIVGSVSSVLYMVPLGMSAAVAIRIGQAIGSNARCRLRMIGLVALATVVVWMSTVMALLLIFGDDIANALSSEPAVVALAATMFVIFAAMQIVDGIQSTSLGALRGMLDNKWPVVTTLTCYWLLALPLAYLFAVPFDLGPNGVWLGYGAGSVFASIALFARFWAKTSGA